jgi:phosphoenolpyruvate synthase/pyruvate phosphate dikinase
MSTRLKKSPEFQDKFQDVAIFVPKTLVISTEGFDSFISENNLEEVATGDFSDEEIIRLFTTARMPDWLKLNLEQFLDSACYPLAVRSSSLLEDAQYQPFAGVYKTYMIRRRKNGSRHSTADRKGLW